MELGAIHPGWIIGIVLYALFRALMGSGKHDRDRLGDGSILQEFFLTLLVIAIVGGCLMLFTTPISGALWKLHPVQDFGGTWAIAVGIPLTLLLGVLVFVGVRRIIFPSRDDRATPADSDPDSDSGESSRPHPVTRPRQWSQRPRPITAARQPSPHDPDTAALKTAPSPATAAGPTPTGARAGLPFALEEDPEDASDLLPLSVIENEPAPVADDQPEGQRGRFTRAANKKLPFDTDDWIRAGFQKYFFLLFGIAVAAFTIALLVDSDRDWDAISGGIFVAVIFLWGAWSADRRLNRY